MKLKPRDGYTFNQKQKRVNEISTISFRVFNDNNGAYFL